MINIEIQEEQIKKIKELKKLLKIKATEIKFKKKALKGLDGNQASGIQSKLHYLRIDIRHYHIAYCTIRGRTMDQIEKPKEGNSPDMHRVNKIISEYKVKEIENAIN